MTLTTVSKTKQEAYDLLAKAYSESVTMTGFKRRAEEALEKIYQCEGIPHPEVITGGHTPNTIQPLDAIQIAETQTIENGNTDNTEA